MLLDFFASKIDIFGQVARLGELVEVSLHPATAEAQVYQVQGAPSPIQVDPVAKKRKSHVHGKLSIGWEYSRNTITGFWNYE